jgi:hypothetical protein
MTFIGPNVEIMIPDAHMLSTHIVRGRLEPPYFHLIGAEIGRVEIKP